MATHFSYPIAGCAVYSLPSHIVYIICSLRYSASAFKEELHSYFALTWMRISFSIEGPKAKPHPDPVFSAEYGHTCELVKFFAWTLCALFAMTHTILFLPHCLTCGSSSCTQNLAFGFPFTLLCSFDVLTLLSTACMTQIPLASMSRA